jgi:Big-like domain-containing protein
VLLGQADVTWDGSSPATGTATLTVGGWQAGFYTIEADYTGDTFDNPSSGRASLAVTPQSPTTLTYTGNASVVTGTSASVSFQLLDNQGNPVALEPVTITVNGQTYAATTDANGTAAVTVMPPVGSYPVSANFSGDANYLASSGSGTLIVTRAPTTIVYTGDTATSGGHTATLSATLTDQNGSPLGGKLVTLSFGSVSCQSTTNLNGIASCTVTVVDPPGSYVVTAGFAGDGTYLASSGTGTITIAGKVPAKIVDNTTGNFLQAASRPSARP